tara:strand:- start:41 stop:268 length:228 start_codon:yes stop_codon:yes gene_type:complete
MTKQIFTMLGGLRKAMSELDNAIPDVAFDHYDLDASHVGAVWDEIDKAEKDFDKLQELAQKGLVAEKYIKEWQQK